jgi:hypothetical protein
MRSVVTRAHKPQGFCTVGEMVQMRFGCEQKTEPSCLKGVHFVGRWNASGEPHLEVGRQKELVDGGRLAAGHVSNLRWKECCVLVVPVHKEQSNMIIMLK